MLLTDTFVRILLNFIIIIIVDSVFFSGIPLLFCLWKYLYNFLSYIYASRYIFLYFFVKKFFLLKGWYFHYIYVFGRVFLVFLSLIIVFIYMFFRTFYRFFGGDFLFLAIFDFVETFFVKRNICNTVDYLRCKFPVLSPFIFLIFGNFRFFRCFRFFYLHIRKECIRQENMYLLLGIRAEKIDAARKMLSQCFLLGWSKYYETFSKTQAEIYTFDSLFKHYVLSYNLENKALKYLFLRVVWLDSPSFIKLLGLKESMRFILKASRRRRLFNENYRN